MEGGGEGEISLLGGHTRLGISSLVRGGGSTKNMMVQAGKCERISARREWKHKIVIDIIRKLAVHRDGSGIRGNGRLRRICPFHRRERARTGEGGGVEISSLLD